MRAKTLLSLLVFVLAVQPVTADFVNCEMARVVTQDGLLENCLAPVSINRVDGEIRNLPARGFLIEPGIHTVNGLATLDTTKCPSVKGDLLLGSSPGMEINFEAGRTYYIAYDHEPVDPAEWRLVIWHVDQPCSIFQACLRADQP
jgi:hypothetical protein